MSVSSRHPLFERKQHQWEKMRDAIEGEEVVKEKTSAYLPSPAGYDGGISSPQYQAYLSRAEFPDIVAPTIQGLSGLIHRKDALYQLPPDLEYLRERATTQGHSLKDLHAMITREILSTGRVGLLATIGQDGKPYIAQYAGDSIINWDQNSDNLPTLVVLDESTYERQGEFDWKKVEKYRVLRADPPTGYTASVQEPNGDGTPQAPSISGRTLTEIPFICAGSLTLGFDPQVVPLLGLAILAFKIYRQDADYQQSLFMTSQPTAWIAGVNKDDKPDKIGASVIWTFTNPEAEAHYLEVSGNGLEAQERAIENNYKRAVQRGAKLFDITKREAESGEALKLRFSSESATVATIAVSSAAALQVVLGHIAKWLGAPAPIVAPNLDFVDSLMTADEVLKFVMAKNQGAPLSWESLHSLFVRGELTKLTWEEEQEKIDAEPPPPPPADEPPVE